MNKPTKPETPEDSKKREYEDYRRCTICGGKGLITQWNGSKSFLLPCPGCNGWGNR